MSSVSGWADAIEVADDQRRHPGEVEILAGHAVDVVQRDGLDARHELFEERVGQRVQRQLRGAARQLLRRLEAARIPERDRRARERQLVGGGRARAREYRPARAALRAPPAR